MLHKVIKDDLPFVLLCQVNYKEVKSNGYKGIGGIMVSVLASSVVDRRFIGGIMVSVLASSVVDRRFIGGIMVSVLASSRSIKPKTISFVFAASPLCH